MSEEPPGAPNARPTDRLAQAEREGIEAFPSEDELRSSGAWSVPSIDSVGQPHGRNLVRYAHDPAPTIETIDVTVTLGGGPARPRRRVNFGLRQAAVLALCLAGLGEVAWFGWAMKGSRPRAVASINRSAVASPGSAIGPAALPGTSPAPPGDTIGARDTPAGRAAHDGKAIPAIGTTSPLPSSGTTPGAPAAPRGGVQTGPPSGWLAVSASAPLEIFEKGRRLGTSRTRLTLSAGRHDLEAVNASLGVRIRTNVTIVNGRALSVALALEPGSVNINALPWASVRVDDAVVGDTPLANLRVAPGRHTVIFSHPVHGERRTTVTVRSDTPTRVSMDMTK